MSTFRALICLLLSARIGLVASCCWGKATSAISPYIPVSNGISLADDSQSAEAFNRYWQRVTRTSRLILDGPENYCDQEACETIFTRDIRVFSIKPSGIHTVPMWMWKYRTMKDDVFGALISHAIRTALQPSKGVITSAPPAACRIGKDGALYVEVAEVEGLFHGSTTSTVSSFDDSEMAADFDSRVTESIAHNGNANHRARNSKVYEASANAHESTQAATVTHKTRTPVPSQEDQYFLSVDQALEVLFSGFENGYSSGSYFTLYGFQLRGTGGSLEESHGVSGYHGDGLHCYQFPVSPALQVLINARRHAQKTAKRYSELSQKYEYLSEEMGEFAHRAKTEGIMKFFGLSPVLIDYQNLTGDAHVASVYKLLTMLDYTPTGIDEMSRVPMETFGEYLGVVVVHLQGMLTKIYLLDSAVAAVETALTNKQRSIVVSMLDSQTKTVVNEIWKKRTV